MTENEINVTDMIKALQCIASQDADGDCYCDHFNAHLTCEQFGDNTRLDEKHMSCGGVLKNTQCCPYSQKTYGVCYEDGELWWLKDIASMLAEIQQYRAIGTVEEFRKLKEKSVAKKPDYEGDGCWDGHAVIDTWICPSCEKHYEVDYDDYDYCPNCGQRIDHSGLTEDD